MNIQEVAKHMDSTGKLPKGAPPASADIHLCLRPQGGKVRARYGWISAPAGEKIICMRNLNEESTDNNEKKETIKQLFLWKILN